VDGAENNWPSYENSRHYEVANNYSLTRHVMAPEVLVASERSWSRMTAEEQSYLQTAAVDSVPLMREMWDTRVDSSRNRVLQSGVELVEDVDHAAFAEHMLPVWDQFLTTPALRALADDIVNVSAGGAEEASDE
jgi:TRAP-type C4-dicarboxylate transport system substrate-binding protein